MRVLIFSHRHPTLSAGGAERAAYSLFEHMKAADAIESCAFVAATPRENIGHSAPIGAFRSRPDEILVSPPPLDDFTQMSANYDELRRILTEILEWHRPEVVHVHHFTDWGIEIFEILASLGAKVAFTAHEFMSICHRFGQMRKTSGQLCHHASPAECTACFPEISSGQFFLRERLMKLYLGFADRLVCPSAFVAQRLTEWGIRPGAIDVIENPASPQLLGVEKDVQGAGQPGVPKRRQLGYFGQINPFKGVDVLLSAMAKLPKGTRELVHLSIYGANLELQSAEFQGRIRSLLSDVEDCVTWMGPYANQDVIDLMRGCDWIVVPSLWWENSPVVLQEAALAGRPVLCSRIGGMAEKVTPGVTGIHFQAGSVADLASHIAQIAEGLSLEVDSNAVRARHVQAVGQHIALYQQLRRPEAARAPAGRRFKPKVMRSDPDCVTPRPHRTASR